MKTKHLGSRLLFLAGLCLTVYALANILRIAVWLGAGRSTAARDLRPAEPAAADWAETNPDIVGWLTVGGTKIDFPLLLDRALHEDYLQNGGFTFSVPGGIEGSQKYLYKYLFCDFRGEPSEVGSITLDPRCGPEDAYVVIYGHNVAAPGVMFSDLKDFEDPAFFAANRTAILYVGGEPEELTLLLTAKISAFAGEVYSPGDTAAALGYLEERSLQGELREHDRYVLLSTCYDDPEGEDRLVLLYGRDAAA